MSEELKNALKQMFGVKDEKEGIRQLIAGGAKMRRKFFREYPGLSRELIGTLLKYDAFLARISKSSTTLAAFFKEVNKICGLKFAKGVHDKLNNSRSFSYKHIKVVEQLHKIGRQIKSDLKKSEELRRARSRAPTIAQYVKTKDQNLLNYAENLSLMETFFRQHPERSMSLFDALLQKTGSFPRYLAEGGLRRTLDALKASSKPSQWALERKWIIDKVWRSATFRRALTTMEWVREFSRISGKSEKEILETIRNNKNRHKPLIHNHIFCPIASGRKILLVVDEKRKVSAARFSSSFNSFVDFTPIDLKASCGCVHVVYISSYWDSRPCTDCFCAVLEDGRMCIITFDFSREHFYPIPIPEIKYIDNKRCKSSHVFGAEDRMFFVDDSNAVWEVEISNKSIIKYVEWGETRINSRILQIIYERNSALYILTSSGDFWRKTKKDEQQIARNIVVMSKQGNDRLFLQGHNDINDRYTLCEGKMPFTHFKPAKHSALDHDLVKNGGFYYGNFLLFYGSVTDGCNPFLLWGTPKGTYFVAGFENEFNRSYKRYKFLDRYGMDCCILGPRPIFFNKEKNKAYILEFKREKYGAVGVGRRLVHIKKARLFEIKFPFGFKFFDFRYNLGLEDERERVEFFRQSFREDIGRTYVENEQQYTPQYKHTRVELTGTRNLYVPDFLKE